MNRRDFLKAAAVGAANVLVAKRPTSEALAKRASRRALDKAAATRKLSEHRIARMSVRRVSDRYGRTTGPNARGRKCWSGASCQVRTVTTDQGASGWAMSHWKPDVLRKFVGARVSDLFDVAEGTADDAMQLDKILHDLAGNILNVPACELMGAAGAREVDIYSGAIYFDDLIPWDKPRGVAGVLASCRQDYRAGYRAFKLKMGRCCQWMKGPAGLKRDIEVTRAVREKFPDCKVLVDANDGWTLEQAVEYVRGVADCDLYFIEEPFEENSDGLKKLRDAMAKAGCKAMIADGERRHRQAKPLTRFGGYVREFTDRLFALAAEKLVDVFVLDLGIVGYTRWRRIMPELIKAHVLASPHTWCWTPRPYYTAQLAAGAGNVCIVEGIPGGAKGIDYSAYKFKDGKLVIPDAPGFGLKLTV